MSLIICFLRENKFPHDCTADFSRANTRYSSCNNLLVRNDVYSLTSIYSSIICFLFVHLVRRDEFVSSVFSSFKATFQPILSSELTLYAKYMEIISKLLHGNRLFSPFYARRDGRISRWLNVSL